MGGHPGGDVASELAAAAAAEVLTSALAEDASADGFTALMRDVMERAVLRAHGAIRERGLEEPGLDGMGTTLTAMVAHPDTGRWVIGHVGDSRAYRVDGDVIEQITRDDTWIQQQIEQNPEIDPARARQSPYAHLLTQCLGLEERPTPQILDGTAGPGTSFLLCSDGLVGMLEDDVMLEILNGSLARNGAGPEATIRGLLDAANQAGGHDNITAALIRFGKA